MIQASLNKGQILLLTLGFAFCSLAYELLFIDLFSVIIGSQVRQFNIIVSIFTFTLGMGSLLFEKFSRSLSLRQWLISIEIGLICSAILAPLLLLASSVSSSFILQKTIAYSSAGLIGILSGFELPIMFKIYKNSYGKVLAFDYLGMIGGTLILPFFLIPELGLGASILLIAATNLFLLTIFLIKRKKLYLYFSVALYFSFCGVIYLQRFPIRDLFTKIYLGEMN